MQPHVQAYRTWRVSDETGEDMYRYVTPQSGKARGTIFLGWQAQRWSSRRGKLCRLGYTDSAALAAHMVAAADLDERLMCQKHLYWWLHHMVTHGDVAARRWLDEVGSARMAHVVAFEEAYPRARARDGGGDAAPHPKRARRVTAVVDEADERDGEAP